jgi:flagellar biosynthetic protein FlhB
VSDDAEKPFDAPPSRLAKARREGNLPRAQEVGSALAFGAAAAAVAALAPLLRGEMMHALQAAPHGDLTPNIVVIGIATLPLTAACVAAMFGGIVQSGGLTVVPIAFKGSRLAPAEGFKRMFSRDAAMHGVRAGAAFALAVALLSPSLVALCASALDRTPVAAAASAWSAALRALFLAAAIGALFAAAEYGVARRGWLRKLRMSLSELKRELKESDGDPLARSRRRALHRSLLRGALSKVADASFVVVNPTHVAVALEYRPPQVPVPVVLVCAADEAALRVREMAAEHRVPVIENVALARALYRDAKVGDAIPHAHYVAVAEIVAALYRSGALD